MAPFSKCRGFKQAKGLVELIVAGMEAGKFRSIPVSERRCVCESFGGIYLCVSGEFKFLYIGKSANLGKRVRSSGHAQLVKSGIKYPNSQIYLVPIDESVIKRDFVERALIKYLDPEFNTRIPSQLKKKGVTYPRPSAIKHKSGRRKSPPMVLVEPVVNSSGVPPNVPLRTLFQVVQASGKN